MLLGELDMNKEAQGTALREVPLEHIMAQKAAQKQEKVSVIFSILTQLTYLNLFVILIYIEIRMIRFDL